MQGVKFDLRGRAVSTRCDGGKNGYAERFCPVEARPPDFINANRTPECLQ